MLKNNLRYEDVNLKQSCKLITEDETAEVRKIWVFLTRFANP